MVVPRPFRTAKGARASKAMRAGYARGRWSGWVAHAMRGKCPKGKGHPSLSQSVRGRGRAKRDRGGCPTRR